ncbi:hypothetical protein SUGI_0573720 [Cryptomeria japonica]|nr:hypothetical protein SUGI_0573720 [Cryptomeria japonica]
MLPRREIVSPITSSGVYVVKYYKWDPTKMGSWMRNKLNLFKRSLRKNAIKDSSLISPTRHSINLEKPESLDGAVYRLLGNARNTGDYPLASLQYKLEPVISETLNKKVNLLHHFLASTEFMACHVHDKKYCRKGHKDVYNEPWETFVGEHGYTNES